MSWEAWGDPPEPELCRECKEPLDDAEIDLCAEPGTIRCDICRGKDNACAGCGNACDHTNDNQTLCTHCLTERFYAVRSERDTAIKDKEQAEARAAALLAERDRLIEVWPSDHTDCVARNHDGTWGRHDEHGAMVAGPYPTREAAVRAAAGLDSRSPGEGSE